MVTMSFNDIAYLAAGLIKYKRDKYGKAFLSDTQWQKDYDSSLFVYLHPNEDGTWYCSYDLNFYGQEIKNQEGARICCFDGDLRNFIRDMRRLKAMYIDV